MFREFRSAVFVSVLLLSAWCRADVPATQPSPPAPQPIEFTQETLDNGLRVVYAPLHTAPVVHVRVLYHVGSRDERPDRQGFAHMFEHMMFRGSAHVAPEEHMKRIGVVGGYSNAFTSFDQTVYVDTIPAEHLRMALYLEADRMASFKVSENIFKTEREVVAKEWGMKNNKPYGNLYEVVMRTAFTTHSYRWTPIGNMDQLKASRVEELQDFFNTYYLPNNAVLVIAGDIDVDAAKAMVHQYFGWIPRGPDVPRNTTPEPAQSEPRRAVVPDRVPLTAVIVGWHIPPYRSADQYPLQVLNTILGDGQSSRLRRLLVNGDHRLCADAYALDESLEDGGFFGVGGMVMLGKNPDEVEHILNDAIADVRDHGVTEAELQKAKTQLRIALIHSRQTCTDIASAIGDEALVGGDANRVNLEAERLDAVTSPDIQAMAQKYFQPNASTTVRIQSDPLGMLAHKAATQPSIESAPVLPQTRPVTPRGVTFPAGYAEHAPMAEPRAAASFEKGVETSIDGVRVIVLSDHRLPTVQWGLTMPHGGHSDPAGKEGLASVTATMVRQSVAGMSYSELNQDLDARAISIDVSDGGDFTRLSGACTVDQLDHAILRSRQVLTTPAFLPDDFTRIVEQTTSALQQSQETPGPVASHELNAALFGDTPLGHYATPASIGHITLDDVRTCYQSVYRPTDALLVFSGDITAERGQELAHALLDNWSPPGAPAANPDYTLGASAGPRIILVDRPGSVQSVVRMGLRAYDIHTEDKFAGSIASQILTAGIDSRLGKYVRATKGLAYAVQGNFQPNRHGGEFFAGTDTDVAKTADAIDAMIKVFNDMRDDEVTPQELADAKTRVAGGMVMGMETIGQQAQYRVDGILNGYPIDYYDKYAARIAQVSAAEVRDVMNHYVKPADFTLVIIGPAKQIEPQLERFGKVEVIPMPSQRQNASTHPSEPELIKPVAK